MAPASRRASHALLVRRDPKISNSNRPRAEMTSLRKTAARDNAPGAAATAAAGAAAVVVAVVVSLRPRQLSSAKNSRLAAYPGVRHSVASGAKCFTWKLADASSNSTCTSLRCVSTSHMPFPS